MLNLYGGARSRASIVKWYLEELKVPYHFVQLDMEAGEHRKPEFLALNPIGKVPVLQDGDFALSESGAILLYLAQKYDPSFPTTPEQQAELYQWVLFANATLGPGVFGEAEREGEAPKILGPLSDLLLHQTYMLGKSFTVADVAVGAVLAYIPVMMPQFDLSAYPGVVAYIQRLAEHPAFKKAMSRDNP
jgi:glutathione S-transferase